MNIDNKTKKNSSDFLVPDAKLILTMLKMKMREDLVFMEDFSFIKIKVI